MIMLPRASVATIGFTHTTAKSFFDRLIFAGVEKIVDVRLHNTSQLAGFAKASDLAYFLDSIGTIKYVHERLLAPTDEILKDYKKRRSDWETYQTRFFALMKERKIEERLNPDFFNRACLLCSEATPHHCHRRLVCEYLNERWGGVLTISHL